MNLFHNLQKVNVEYSLHSNIITPEEKKSTKGKRLHSMKLFNRKINDQRNQEFRILLFLLILFLSGAGMWVVKAEARDSNSVQKGIAAEIIRFHVIANSDSVEDQSLKYKVKDSLVEKLSPYLKDTNDITEARNYLKGHLTFIKKTAEEIIHQYGSDYPVNVTLEPCYFPIKVYGEFTFPAGTYEALRVQIGKAEGQNWWCVMFPPLCFVDETYSIVDNNSEEQLKYLLTEEEYEALRSKKTPVKIKFKIWESLKKLFN